MYWSESTMLQKMPEATVAETSCTALFRREILTSDRFALHRELRDERAVRTASHYAQRVELPEPGDVLVQLDGERCQRVVRSGYVARQSEGASVFASHIFAGLPLPGVCYAVAPRPVGSCHAVWKQHSALRTVAGTERREVHSHPVGKNAGRNDVLQIGNIRDNLQPRGLPMPLFFIYHVPTKSYKQYND